MKAPMSNVTFHTQVVKTIQRADLCNFLKKEVLINLPLVSNYEKQDLSIVSKLLYIKLQIAHKKNGPIKHSFIK